MTQGESLSRKSREFNTPTPTQTMKYTRIFAFLNIITLLGTLSLTRLDSHGQEADGKQIPEWLQKESAKVTKVITDLNAEQKTKLAAAIQTRTEALAKVKALKDGGASAEEVKDKTVAAWTAYTHDAKSFLTDEQFEKFKELHKPKSAASNQ